MYSEMEKVVRVDLVVVVESLKRVGWQEIVLQQPKV